MDGTQQHPCDKAGKWNREENASIAFKITYKCIWDHQDQDAVAGPSDIHCGEQVESVLPWILFVIGNDIECDGNNAKSQGTINNNAQIFNLGISVNRGKVADNAYIEQIAYYRSLDGIDQQQNQTGKEHDCGKQ